MKPFNTIALLIAYALMSFSSSPPSHALDASGSMCAKADQVIFLCPLRKTGKIVSVCAAGDVDRGEGRFYYAYGSPTAPELVYPAKDHSVANVLANSHLVYGGAGGETAYSFVNKGYRYIVYSVCGTGFDDGGVLVQRKGARHAAKDMKCQQGRITESTSDKNLSLMWVRMPVLFPNYLKKT